MKANSFLQSFQYALSGLWYTVCSQRNMKIHLAAAGLALAFAWCFDFEPWEYAVLVLTIGAVLVAEAINTAIETVVDLISPERHPLAKLAKDIAAGAVLISAAVSVFTAYLLFWPRIKG